MVHSRDHGQFRAGVLVFEEPVTHIDGKIDLFALDDLKFALVLLHVDGDKFVADLGGMLRRVHQTELRLLQLVEVLWLCLAIAFASLLPADFI